MSYFNNKNLFKSQIRRPENLWFSMADDNRLEEFYAIKSNQKDTLLTGAGRLEKGAIVHPAEDPAAKLLIISDDDHGAYFSHEILPITHYAVVRRFDAGDGPRDAFGRLQVVTPETMFDDIPLALTATSTKDANTPDRSGQAVTYSFSTAAKFGLKKGDRLLIGEDTLMISTILLSSTANITEFRAISSP